MEHPLPDTDLVVATPERVSFDYQVAGLGTRAIAQLLDLLILAAILIAVILAGIGAGALAGSDSVATLIEILGSFVVVFGYFWISEAIWSGQTIGKKVFRLRAVGDRGEPLRIIYSRYAGRVYGLGVQLLGDRSRGQAVGRGEIADHDPGAVALDHVAELGDHVGGAQRGFRWPGAHRAHDLVHHQPRRIRGVAC